MYEIFEQLIRQKGISTYKVSKETGISQATLSDWKRGRSTPKADKMQKIADYFGVSVDYLLGNEMLDEKKSPAEIAEDDFQFALLNGTKDLTEEGKKELLQYKDYLFHKYIKKDK